MVEKPNRAHLPVITRGSHVIDANNEGLLFFLLDRRRILAGPHSVWGLALISHNCRWINSWIGRLFLLNCVNENVRKCWDCIDNLLQFLWRAGPTIHRSKSLHVKDHQTLTIHIYNFRRKTEIQMHWIDHHFEWRWQRIDETYSVGLENTRKVRIDG